MKNLKKIFAVSIFLGVCFCLFAESQKIKEHVDEKYYEKLVKEGSITIYRDDGSSDYRLLPKSDYANQINKCKVEKDKKTLVIIEALVKLAHNLNIEVVVEGVEEKEQYEYLKELSCDKIQGYYISKAVPEEEFI